MKTIIYLLLMVCTHISFAQTIIFVQANAPAGGNGTIARPFNKIADALYTAPNGQPTTIYLRAGTFKEAVFIFKSGNTSGFLSIEPYQNETVILDGTEVSNSPKEGVVIVNQSYVRIKGLKIRNYIGNYSKGIAIIEASHHIEILNNEIEQIHFSSNDVSPLQNYSLNTNPIVVRNINTIPAHTFLIKGNKVHDCRTGYSEGIQVSGNVDNFVIEENIVYNIKNIGIVAGGFHGLNTYARRGKIFNNVVYNCKSPVALAAGIYIDGARNITAERNKVYNCQRGFAINCETPNQYASRDTLRNNIAYNNTRAGFSMGGLNSAYGGWVDSSAIVYNTSYNNFQNTLEPEETSPADFGEITLDFSKNSVVKNNIFHNGNRSRILNSYSSYINLQLNHNLWFSDGSLSNLLFVYNSTPYYAFSNYQNTTNQDRQSVVGQPSFMNAALGDFRLLCNSKAIGIADLAVNRGNTDFGGGSRLYGTYPDAGADEYENTIIKSISSGAWHSTTTWDCNCVPIACDTVMIQNSHIISIQSLARAKQVFTYGQVNIVANGNLVLGL